MPFVYGIAATPFVFSTYSSHMIVSWVIPGSLIPKQLDYFRFEGRKLGTKTAALKHVPHATSANAARWEKEDRTCTICETARDLMIVILPHIGQNAVTFINYS